MITFPTFALPGYIIVLLVFAFSIIANLMFGIIWFWGWFAGFKDAEDAFNERRKKKSP